MAKLPPDGIDQEKTVHDNEHSRSASSSTHRDDMSIRGEQRMDAIGAENEQNVAELARQISNISRHSVKSEKATPENPFLSTDNPLLDPNSEEFSPRAWIKALLSVSQHDPKKYTRPTAGVSFRNLSVNGSLYDTDYQKTVVNVFLQFASFVKSTLGFRNKRKIHILREFDGLVRSGEMLVVLGKPGSGETYGFEVDPESKLCYQGIPKELMHKQFRANAIYQAENDFHFTNLTVNQTLKFAALAKTPRNRLPGVTREQYAEHIKDVIIATFGLKNAADTLLMMCSGGETKRVSIGEVALSYAAVQCWDNTTRGLDSAVALSFVKTLALNAETSGATVLVAIYQSSESAYQQFDKVTVLYEGRQIYFGPCNKAKEYFVRLGYHCPPRQATPDFLTAVTSPSEREVRPGFEDRVPRTAEELEEAWKNSDERQALLKEIEAYESEYPVGGPHLGQFKEARDVQKSKSSRKTSPYTISFPMQVKICTQRGFQRLRGDMTLFISSIVGNGIMSLIVASAFFNQPHTTDSFFGRGSLLFFAILLNGFASALEILTLFHARPIIEKHDRYAFYKPSAEACASFVVDMPLKICTAIVFNLILYFMTNLRREPGAFFVFLLFSFSTTISMSFLFRVIGTYARTIHRAMPAAAVFILALIMYTGFSLPPSDMPPWFGWIQYINPIAYGFESIMINEFSGQNYPCSAFIPMGPGYENISDINRACSAPGSVPGQDFVNGDRYLATSFKYEKSHKWRNLGVLWAFSALFAIVYLIGADLVTAAKSKGEVLVFRRGEFLKQKKAKSATDDTEAATKDLTPIDHSISLQNSVALQKQTAILHWRDVTYDVKVKGGSKRLLRGIDGWTKPNSLTALVGVTGAGKTTLLNVLASRVTIGVVAGNININGNPRTQSFQRKTGYVQQQDFHLQTSTVREALTFSALLRQPREISREEKLKYVDEIIRILEMENFSEAIIGVPGIGLNVEQRKRLTIGVELAAKPELLLFVDEFSSGLDSQTAYSICQLLKTLAHNGMAIVCSIHQPSSILFAEFDKLLLLGSGGRQIYFGDTKDMVGYFEKYSHDRISEDANPAEWMLEVIGAAPGSHTDIDWPRVWKDSSERRIVREEVERMERELPSTAPDLPMSKLPSSEDKFAVSTKDQFVQVVIRTWQQTWRTPSYVLAKFYLCFATGLFVGFSFFQAPNSLQGMQNQCENKPQNQAFLYTANLLIAAFSIFLLLTVFSNVVQGILPKFVENRDLYEHRERESKTFSWQVFIVANILVEIPWQILGSVLTYVSFYFPIYKPSESDAGLFFLFTLGFYLFASTFAFLIVAGFETAEAAGNLGNLLFSLCLIFCGVLVRPEHLGFWKFMWRISPFSYIVAGFLNAGIANKKVTCNGRELVRVDPPGGKTCGEYFANYIMFAGGGVNNPNATSKCEFCAISSTNVFLNQLKIFYSDRWRDFGLIMIYFVFNAFAAVAIYYWVRVPRLQKAEEGEGMAAEEEKAAEEERIAQEKGKEKEASLPVSEKPLEKADVISDSRGEIMVEEDAKNF